MLAYQRFTPAIRIGCSATGLPASRWLEHYARHLDTVEIDNRFIGRPRRGSIRQFTLLTSHFSVRVQVRFRFGVRSSGFGVTEPCERQSPVRSPQWRLLNVSP